MNYEEIKAAWNAQADEYNQWDKLSAIEKIEWAAAIATEMEQASRALAVHRAVQEEREACAKVCEEISDGYMRSESRRFPEMKTDAQTGASDCEDAIRARWAKA